MNLNSKGHVCLGDIDGDGDLDVVRSNLWFENADGKGTRWVARENIPFANPQQPYPLATHCVVLDLDRDGDADLVMTENEIKDGRIGWLENLDGKGGRFVEHVILDAKLGGHLAVAADVDGDGDVDIVSKLWRPRKDNANQGRNHVDLLENLLIN